MSDKKKNDKNTNSNKIFEGVMEGLKEAKDFLDGKPNKCIIHNSMDIKNIRKKQKLSQSKFANTFGINVETIRNWEQNKRTPNRIAQILLSVIDSYPNIVKKVVGAN